MLLGKKTQELKLEIVDAEEMSQEDAEVVIRLLAKIIYDSMQRESMEEVSEVTEGSGAGS